MKKVMLSILLLAAVAVSASAEYYAGNNGVSYAGPNRGQFYSCTYTNYRGTAVNAGEGGYSYWTLFTYQAVDGRPLPRGTEHFLAKDRYGTKFWDGYKATWSAPVNLPEPGVPYLSYTEWDYTFNPYGPQCTKAEVHYSGIVLVFKECSDGHSRYCQAVY